MSLKLPFYIEIESKTYKTDIKFILVEYKSILNIVVLCQKSITDTNIQHKRNKDELIKNLRPQKKMLRRNIKKFNLKIVINGYLFG